MIFDLGREDGDLTTELEIQSTVFDVKKSCERLSKLLEQPKKALQDYLTEGSSLNNKIANQITEQKQ